jgi:tRNA threonylcarbamoyladenosine biosynthesis protein TsaE
MTAMDLIDEAQTDALGRMLASAWDGQQASIYLVGELGAGKTTLARGLLRGLGVAGTVRSPTYTLVEPYETERGSVAHLDLYRIASSAELEFLGLRDLAGSLLLIEWPERGDDQLPDPDLVVQLSHVRAAPGGSTGRRAEISAKTPIGEKLMASASLG